LAATRRFGRWLSRLWWREWWPVAVAVDGRRKVAKERGSAVRSLYEVVWRLIVMEMEVFKPVVTMLVVEHRGGERERERERERESAGSRNQVRKACFLAVFGPKFIHLWSMKITYIYRWWKRDTLSLLVPNFGLWFDPKALQPLLQRSNDELPVLCRKMTGWVGYFRVVPPPRQSRSARKVYTSV
jgi:hypothetical protein